MDGVTAAILGRVGELGWTVRLVRSDGSVTFIAQRPEDPARHHVASASGARASDRRSGGRRKT